MWKTLRKKSKTESVDASQEEEQDETQEDSSQLLKLTTLYISEDTDVVGLIKDNFPEDELKGMMLVGLHTCGNLAASSLRLFTNNLSHLKCMVNVSCCYHLLMEEFDGNASWLEEELQSSGFGFPMSAYLKDQDFALGRNARMLAAQPPERISSTGAVSVYSRRFTEDFGNNWWGYIKNQRGVFGIILYAPSPPHPVIMGGVYLYIIVTGIMFWHLQAMRIKFYLTLER